MPFVVTIFKSKTHRNPVFVRRKTLQEAMAFVEEVTGLSAHRYVTNGLPGQLYAFTGVHEDAYADTKQYKPWRTRFPVVVPADETLDNLLSALTHDTRDMALVAVVADRLDEINHPAAGWWRERLETRLHSFGYDRRGRLLWLHGHDATLTAGPENDEKYPGIADLCQRIEAVRPLEQRATAEI